MYEWTRAATYEVQRIPSPEASCTLPCHTTRIGHHLCWSEDIITRTPHLHLSHPLRQNLPHLQGHEGTQLLPAGAKGVTYLPNNVATLWSRHLRGLVRRGRRSEQPERPVEALFRVLLARRQKTLQTCIFGCG